ncbi:MAG TPA: cupredoxin domain-containing protein [Mycobacteriales bacterium]|nr:cupredoxin domain-containing protein [Mycobacteriales bacterium]
MTRTIRIAVACLSLTMLAACGDDGADSAGSPSASVPDTATTAPATDAAVTGDVVEVLATANLKFVPNELTATVGKEFKGVLVQRGSIPHNIEIKDVGVKGEDTMVNSAGDKKEFSFTPTKAGSFKFLCTIHPAQMTGTLTVS